MTAQLHRNGLFFALACLILMSSAAMSSANAVEQMTPLLLAVHDARVPFMGSDGKLHLVYELWMSNFSSGDLKIEKVEVLGDGTPLQTFDAASITGRLQPAGQRESVGTLPKSAQALLFLHVVLQPGSKVPKALSHHVAIHLDAAPPEYQNMTEEGGTVDVDQQAVVAIGPPLQGQRYVSDDSCCDASRHTRAAMPINGRVWLAQRYAVDWEQLDSHQHIYSGPREKLTSYTIYGQPVLAVADATVVSVINDQPEQVPGEFPKGISFDQADGNSVLLDLGNGHYAMYAHMQPGSVRVHSGESVTRGQVLGLVGDSGNSIAPHLHFQVMDRPSSLASNGLPYEIDSFEVTAGTPGTAAFDEAEAKGTPLAITQHAQPQKVTNALPLDQLIISFVQR